MPLWNLVNENMACIVDFVSYRHMKETPQGMLLFTRKSAVMRTFMYISQCHLEGETYQRHQVSLWLYGPIYHTPQGSFRIIRGHTKTFSVPEVVFQCSDNTLSIHVVHFQILYKCPKKTTMIKNHIIFLFSIKKVSRYMLKNNS